MWVVPSSGLLGVKLLQVLTWTTFSSPLNKYPEAGSRGSQGDIRLTSRETTTPFASAAGPLCTATSDVQGLRLFHCQSRAVWRQLAVDLLSEPFS